MREKSICRIALLLLLILMGTAGAETVITVSFTGDVTLGGVETGRNNPESFDSYAAREGYDYFFRNLQDLFQNDDLTLVNLEGVLSDSARNENKKKNICLRGQEDFAEILTVGGIEACAVANNHMMDYGRQGYNTTIRTLQNHGLKICGNDLSFEIEKNGIRIGFFSFSGGYLTKANMKAVRETIADMRRTGVNAVVCCFHAGQEYAPKRRKWDQERYAKTAVEEWGADLVIMHHPHVLQGIDRIRNRYVFYSLGNFCFGGSTVIRNQEGNRQIRTLESMVLQMDLVFDEQGKLLGQEGRIYPCYISSSAVKAGDVNDYQPKRVIGEQARNVIQRIQEDTAFDLGEPDGETGVLTLPFLAVPEKEE